MSKNSTAYILLFISLLMVVVYRIVAIRTDLVSLWIIGLSIAASVIVILLPLFNKIKNSISKIKEDVYNDEKK